MKYVNGCGCSICNKHTILSHVWGMYVGSVCKRSVLVVGHSQCSEEREQEDGVATRIHGPHGPQPVAHIPDLQEKRRKEGAKMHPRHYVACATIRMDTPWYNGACNGAKTLKHTYTHVHTHARTHTHTHCLSALMQSTPYQVPAPVDGMVAEGPGDDELAPQQHQGGQRLRSRVHLLEGHAATDVPHNGPIQPWGRGRRGVKSYNTSIQTVLPPTIVEYTIMYVRVHTIGTHEGYQACWVDCSKDRLKTVFFATIGIPISRVNTCKLSAQGEHSCFNFMKSHLRAWICTKFNIHNYTVTGNVC